MNTLCGAQPAKTTYLILSIRDNKTSVVQNMSLDLMVSDFISEHAVVHLKRRVWCEFYVLRECHSGVKCDK